MVSKGFSCRYIERVPDSARAGLLDLGGKENGAFPSRWKFTREKSSLAADVNNRGLLPIRRPCVQSCPFVPVPSLCAVYVLPSGSGSALHGSLVPSARRHTGTGEPSLVRAEVP